MEAQALEDTIITISKGSTIILSRTLMLSRRFKNCFDLLFKKSMSIC
jgi:hypothetical protein